MSAMTSLSANKSVAPAKLILDTIMTGLNCRCSHEKCVTITVAKVVCVTNQIMFLCIIICIFCLIFF